MAGATECFVTGVAEYFVADVVECFVDVFLVVPSACHHPNPSHALIQLCRWGNTVPMSTSLQLVLALPIAWGIAATWGGVSV